MRKKKQVTISGNGVRLRKLITGFQHNTLGKRGVNNSVVNLRVILWPSASSVCFSDTMILIQTSVRSRNPSQALNNRIAHSNLRLVKTKATLNWPKERCEGLWWTSGKSHACAHSVLSTFPASVSPMILSSPPAVTHANKASAEPWQWNWTLNTYSTIFIFIFFTWASSVWTLASAFSSLFSKLSLSLNGSGSFVWWRHNTQLFETLTY